MLLYCAKQMLNSIIRHLIIAYRPILRFVPLIVILRSYCAVAQSDRSGHEDKGGAKALTAKRHIWPDWQRHNWDCDGNQDTL